MRTEQLTANIVAEAQRIEEDAEHSGKGHLNAARLWQFVNYVLGIPMTLCAAFSGVQSLNEKPVWATVLAFIAAALGGLQTFINPEQKISSHKDSGNRYLSLRNNTRTFREIELLQCDDNQAAKHIKQLNHKRNTLNESSLSIPRSAWLLAKKDIDAGYAQYRADTKDQGESQ
jgi:hypothetical protein